MKLDRARRDLETHRQGCKCKACYRREMIREMSEP